VAAVCGAEKGRKGMGESGERGGEHCMQMRGGKGMGAAVCGPRKGVGKREQREGQGNGGAGCGERGREGVFNGKEDKAGSCWQAGFHVLKCVVASVSLKVCHCVNAVAQL